MFAALAFDAARVLFDAIRRANSTDPRKIRDALAQTKNYPGVTGRINIDADRNAAKPVVLAVILSTADPPQTRDYSTSQSSAAISSKPAPATVNRRALESTQIRPNPGPWNIKFRPRFGLVSKFGTGK
jgi:hypothetical protein